MPFTLIWQESRLNIHVTGDFDEEAIGITSRYLNDQRFDQVTQLFIDLEAVQDFSIPATAVHNISKLQLSQEHSQRVMSVALLVKGLLGFGIARMWENFLDVSGKHNWDIQIFEERQEAEQWLGLSGHPGT